jgi:hypothetical protein
VDLFHELVLQVEYQLLILDLGTTLGWAMHDEIGKITSGTVSFKSGRYEGGGIPYLRFKRWLTEIKQTCGGIDAVYFEEVRRHLGTDAARKYGGFLEHLTAWAEHHQIPYQGIPVGTIKRHITGKGNASKAEVIEAVRAKGFKPVDDNEADALALLDFVLEKYKNQGGDCETQ